MILPWRFKVAMWGGNVPFSMHRIPNHVGSCGVFLDVFWRVPRLLRGHISPHVSSWRIRLASTILVAKLQKLCKDVDVLVAKQVHGNTLCLKGLFSSRVLRMRRRQPTQSVSCFHGILYRLVTHPMPCRRPCQRKQLSCNSYRPATLPFSSCKTSCTSAAKKHVIHPFPEEKWTNKPYLPIMWL